MKKIKYGLLLLAAGFFFTGLSGQNKSAPKPLFDDPVYHGAADPVVIYNPMKKKWWMFYTNRRASIEDSTVQWVHGTRIGIAESRDGRKWKYLDTCAINYHPDPGYTHWAPDIIRENDTWHMYLTYVPGTFRDWNHPRTIIHLASRDMKNWEYQSTLPLVNQKVIDASVYKINDTLYRLWYNNEKDGKSIWYADSRDLYQWHDKGLAIKARGEGPKVFYWKEKYFMIVDAWKGMEIYSSIDLLNWVKQPERILEQAGKGKDDQAIGGHCEVLVQGDRAFVFYFTHPGRRKDAPAPEGSYENKRSVIQVAELEYNNGKISCDRDRPVYLRLNSN